MQRKKRNKYILESELVIDMDIDTDNRDAISDHQVLQSNAGYYVGTLYFDSEMNGWFPNSRVSDYFKTKMEAKNYLNYLQQCE